MSKGRELIKKLNQLTSTEIYSGDKVFRRPLSAPLGLEFTSKVQKGAALEVEDFVRIVAECAVEDNGSPLFSNHEEVLELPFQAIVQIAKAVLRDAGVTPSEEGESVPKA